MCMKINIPESLIVIYGVSCFTKLKIIILNFYYVNLNYRSEQIHDSCSCCADLSRKIYFNNFHIVNIP